MKVRVLGVYLVTQCMEEILGIAFRIMIILADSQMNLMFSHGNLNLEDAIVWQAYQLEWQPCVFVFMLRDLGRGRSQPPGQRNVKVTETGAT